MLLDSGIRSGADAFVAVALGASAVLLGRPFAWGLALGGEDGVRQVISDVLGEFDLTLGLTGHTSVDQLSPDILRRVADLTQEMKRLPTIAEVESVPVALKPDGEIMFRTVKARTSRGP